MIDTKGTGIINTLFAGYFPKWENIEASAHGSLVVHEAGTSTAYALLSNQERGEMFIGPGVKGCDGECGITCTTVQDLLAQLTQNLKNNQTPPQALSAYSLIVMPLLDTLKSITGKVFTSAKEYDQWWIKEGANFEVIDPEKKP